MKVKAAISSGAPAALFDAFGSSDFALRFLEDIVDGVFGADDPSQRPAEYYVQLPDRTVQPADRPIGIEVRLTGVSRGSREPRVFHRALQELTTLVERTARNELAGSGAKAQVFVVIMIDGDVPGIPGSGHYGSVLESEPKWVGHGHAHEVESDPGDVSLSGAWAGSPSGTS